MPLDIPKDTPVQIPIDNLPPEGSDNVVVAPSGDSPMLSLDELMGDKPVSSAAPASKTPAAKSTNEKKISVAELDTNDDSDATPSNAALKDSVAKDNKAKAQPEEEEDEDTEDEEAESKEKEGAEGEAEDEEDKAGATAKDNEQGVEDKDKDANIHGNTKRDYSGFDADEIKILKKLDMGRFNKVSAKWKGLKAEASKVPQLVQERDTLQKQLREGGVPESWAEHPQAYTLAPEYQRLSSDISRIDFEENFYRQQQLNVREGKEWQHITGYDQTTGQPILSPPQPANNKADIWLTSVTAKAGVLRANIENRLGGLQQSFVTQHKQAADNIRREIDSVEQRLIEPLRPKEEDVKLMLEQLPPSMRNNPMAYGYGKMFGIILQQARYIKGLHDKQQSAAKIANDKKLAGPSISKTPRDPSSASNKAVTSKNSSMLDIKDFVRDED